MKETAGKKELRIRKANNAAYATLIMACKGRAFGHVNSSRDADFPDASAKLAWEKLSKAYKSNTMLDMVELMDRLSRCTLEGDSNPDAWSNEKAHIKRLVKTKAPISDETMLVAHRITKLPKQYRPLVVGLQLTTNTYKVEEIQKQVTVYWNREERWTRNEGRSGSL